MSQSFCRYIYHFSNLEHATISYPDCIGIQQSKQECKESIKKKREEEGNVLISAESWEKICCLQWKKNLSWENVDPPFIEEWMDIIHEIYIMENLKFSLRVQKETFYKILSKWMEYVRPIRSDFICLSYTFDSSNYWLSFHFNSLVHVFVYDFFFFFFFQIEIKFPQKLHYNI